MNTSLSLPGLIEEQPLIATDVELLTLCLTGQTRGKALEISSHLLQRFGGWCGLWQARREDVAATVGMGPEKLARWEALREILNRSSPSRIPKIASAAKEAVRFFSGLQTEEQEVVSAALLHSNHELIRVVNVFRGTVSEALAQPREILREALKANAAKFILAHNHLSTCVEPSEKDLRLTTRMEWAAETLGIPLLDHFIIGSNGGYFSFAEAGLLGPRRSDSPRRGSVFA